MLIAIDLHYIMEFIGLFKWVAADSVMKPKFYRMDLFPALRKATMLIPWPALFFLLLSISLSDRPLNVSLWLSGLIVLISD